MGTHLSTGRSMGTKTWLVVTILGFASITLASLPTPELSGSMRSITRNPRLFYVSTSTSTSSATTRCFIAAATAACKRKRRNLVADDLERHTNIAVIPSRKFEGNVADELESQFDGEEENIERDAKMMLYWVTTTTTPTFYMATSTLATLDCVPGGWEVNTCG